MMDQIKIGKFKVNEIYQGDSLKLMKEIPDESIDLLVTDPPFAIDFRAKRNNYNRTPENVLEGYNEIPQEKYFEFTLNWIKQSYRILKQTGSMYVVSGWTNLKDILNALDETRFITVNHIIWKYQFGVFTRKKYVTSHYHILFVVKHVKKYKFNKIEHYPEDVWVIKREYWTGKKKTATKLPMELVRKIILFSSDKDDIVFDPFLGSGTVAATAKTLGRNYLGFEIVKDYFTFAKERISSIQMSLDKWVDKAKKSKETD
jgi:site-specific DNA-methyltransferase (adenine-specific)